MGLNSVSTGITPAGLVGSPLPTWYLEVATQDSRELLVYLDMFG